MRIILIVGGSRVGWPKHKALIPKVSRFNQTHLYHLPNMLGLSGVLKLGKTKKVKPLLGESLHLFDVVRDVSEVLILTTLVPLYIGKAFVTTSIIISFIVGF